MSENRAIIETVSEVRMAIKTPMPKMLWSN